MSLSGATRGQTRVARGRRAPANPGMSNRPAGGFVPDAPQHRDDTRRPMTAAQAKNSGEPSGAWVSGQHDQAAARNVVPVIARAAERDFIRGAVWIINDANLMRRFIGLVAALVAVLPRSARRSRPRRAEEGAPAGSRRRATCPEQPGFVERQILAHRERAGGFGVPRGLFVTFGDIKRGSGIALGPAYGKLLANGTIVAGKVAYSIRNFKIAQVRGARAAASRRPARSSAARAVAGCARRPSLRARARLARTRGRTTPRRRPK